MQANPPSSQTIAFNTLLPHDLGDDDFHVICSYAGYAETYGHFNVVKNWRDFAGERDNVIKANRIVNEILIKLICEPN